MYFLFWLRKKIFEIQKQPINERIHIFTPMINAAVSSNVLLNRKF